MTLLNLAGKLAVIFLLSTSLMACLAQGAKPVLEPDSNPRIIYRDLLAWANDFSNADKLTVTPVCENEKVQEVILQKKEKVCPVISVEKTPENKPVFQLTFRNESIVIDSDLNEGLQNINTLLNDESHYLVVGHSHGASAKGNSYLASARAEKVSRWLESKGLSSANIHTFSSWSAAHQSFAPKKGVQVFKVEKDFTLTFS